MASVTGTVHRHRHGRRMRTFTRDHRRYRHRVDEREGSQNRRQPAERDGHVGAEALECLRYVPEYNA